MPRNDESTNVDLGDNVAMEGRSNTYYPPTQHDQFAAYFYISAALKSYVPQIVARILELADYWVVSTVQSSEHLEISEYMRDISIYLRSNPIIGYPRLPVRKIIFSITSNDQGWSSDTEFHNTYDHSWTWFEAGREKTASSEDFTGTCAAVPGPMILRNLHACSDSKQHRVCWPASADEDSAGDEQGLFYWMDGRDECDVRQWVNQLRCGDCVVIIPRAKFPGWRNYVHRAEIKIFTSFIKQSSG